MKVLVLGAELGDLVGKRTMHRDDLQRLVLLAQHRLDESEPCSGKLPLLPNAIQSNLFTLLSLNSVASLAATSKILSAQSKNNAVWKSFCLREWPALLNLPALANHRLFYAKHCLNAPAAPIMLHKEDDLLNPADVLVMTRVSSSFQKHGLTGMVQLSTMEGSSLQLTASNELSRAFWGAIRLNENWHSLKFDVRLWNLKTQQGLCILSKSWQQARKEDDESDYWWADGMVRAKVSEEFVEHTGRVSQPDVEHRHCHLSFSVDQESAFSWTVKEVEENQNDSWPCQVGAHELLEKLKQNNWK